MNEVELRHERRSSSLEGTSIPRIALLTGGGDKHYAFGLASALTSKDIFIDFVGSDQLASPTVEDNPRINFLNLHGNQNPHVNPFAKVRRITLYYFRLLWFAATANAAVFHILWNNKVESFDRTFLLLYYKLCGRRVVFTAHNVNAAKRDAVDNWINRFTLYLQYKLVDHIFVHTKRSGDEIQSDFRVHPTKISLIPYGINDVVRDSDLSASDAKRRLALKSSNLTILFFGQIAPYKGLEYLLAAFTQLQKQSSDYQLIIAGKPKWDNVYWKRMEKIIAEAGIEARVTQRIGFVPDEQIEWYFKAADVLVLPYTHIFQSGVLFLAYSFGLPVIATDVGSLKEEIVEGQTGFVCAPRDSAGLAKTIHRYFASELYRNLENGRAEIKQFANERYSWSKVAAITAAIYSELLSAGEGSRSSPRRRAGIP